MTVPINVKNLLDFCHESGHKFYPSIIYLVTKVLNQMENFRMFRDAEGNLCVWDQVVPNYTIFHEDDKAFSDCWTGYSDDFETFYREYASYGELSETYACGASTCLLVKVINYALKYSNEFIEIESDQTNQIVRYLDQHFLKEIGVEDLARTFHMSKSSLNKFFQKQLNTTCHQYILKKRLALAVSLIRQDVPLKTVAVQSGFGDYSSFFRAFKKMYHISPTECQADNEKLKKIKH